MGVVYAKMITSMADVVYNYLPFEQYYQNLNNCEQKDLG